MGQGPATEVTHLRLNSLVPRPHPLLRRNGLVNQVEFLGLAHAFATAMFNLILE